MAHSFLFALITLLVSFGCAKKTDRDYAVLSYSWEKHEKIKLTPSRMVASDSEPECRSDFFEKDLVAKENKILEEKLEKRQKIPGNWKHLQLASLPNAQANFLLNYGKDLGDYNKKDYDFSLCQDVPCILNVIYETPGGIAGQVIYFWYLKMGSLLAVDNKVSEQISTMPGIYMGKSFPLKSYLFSLDELYGFWRLAQSLPPRYSMLTNLDEIQRIPKSSSIENEDASVCGLASNGGDIRVNDGCLMIGNGQNRGEGYFYQAVTHELSHEIDFFTALSIKPRTSYYSHTDEWKKEGGWIIREILDASTGAIKIRQWDTDLGADKFISNYAQTSPPEHFAETLSFMYDSGDTSKKTIPPSTYDLVQKKFFDENEYDSQHFKTEFLAMADQYDVALFNATEDCLKNPAGTPLAPADAIFTKFFPTVSAPAVKNCLAARMKVVAQLTMKDINRGKFYGCVYTKGKEAAQFKNELVTMLSNKMIHHYQAYLTDKNYFNLFTQFYKQFETVREAQFAFMSCQGENDEEACYEASLRKQIIELMPPELEFKETAIADLLAQYLERYPLMTAHDETMKMYQQFVISSQNLIRDNAKHVWDSCKKLSPEDQLAPTGAPFSAKTQYVVSSLMNCLNQAIGSELENLVLKFDSDVLVKNEKEKRLLYQLSLPFYLKNLDGLLTDAVVSEGQQIKSYVENEKLAIKNKLVEDFSWLKITSDKKQLELACLAEAQKNILLPLYFHLKKNSFDHFSAVICAEVLVSPEFVSYNEKVYQSSWGAAEENLKTSLTTKATVAAKDCLAFYPRSSGMLETMNSKKRLICFDEQWSYQEVLTLREFNESGPGSKYTYDQVELKQRYKIIALQVKEQLKKLFLQ